RVGAGASRYVARAAHGAVDRADHRTRTARLPGLDATAIATAVHRYCRRLLSAPGRVMPVEPGAPAGVRAALIGGRPEPFSLRPAPNALAARVALSPSWWRG